MINQTRTAKIVIIKIKNDISTTLDYNGECCLNVLLQCSFISIQGRTCS